MAATKVTFVDWSKWCHEERTKLGEDKFRVWFNTWNK